MECNNLVSKGLAAEFGAPGSGPYSYLGAHFPATIIPLNAVLAGLRLKITLTAQTLFTYETTSLTAETGETCIIADLHIQPFFTQKKEQFYALYPKVFSHQTIASVTKIRV
jgi:hypothetical protein